VAAINRELTDLEKTLENQMALQREDYIRNSFDRRLKDYHTDLPRKISDYEKGMQAIWQNLQARLADLVNDFHLKYMLVFGISRMNGVIPSKLDVVCHAGTLPRDLTDEEFASLHYDLASPPTGTPATRTPRRILPSPERWNSRPPPATPATTAATISRAPSKALSRIDKSRTTLA
jgi:hypothetical protein